MKTVFSNTQCAHVWAQMTQPHGHSQSMSFKDHVIYSYRTPVAALYRASDPFNIGQHAYVCLINSKRYSPTTSCKHMPAVRRAVSHLRSFHVPDVGGNYSAAPNHAVNLAYLMERYATECKRLSRVVNCWDASMFYNALEPIARDIHNYASLFNVTIPDGRTYEPQLDANELLELWRAREAKKQTPAYIVAQARKAALKLANEHRLREEQIAAAGDALKEWRAHLRRDIAGYGRQSINGGAYLRLSTDGRTVQTSLGASVPVSDARRMLLFIRNIVAELRSTDTADMTFDEGPTVGSFTLRNVSASGNVRIGCHFIEADELASIARIIKADMAVAS